MSLVALLKYGLLARRESIAVNIARPVQELVLS